MYKFKCRDCESLVETETLQSPYSCCPQCDGELVPLDPPGLIKEPFVLVGKAKEVFKWLEIKTRRAMQAREDMGKIEIQTCPYDKEAKCDLDHLISCAYADCEVWMNIPVEPEKGTKNERD